jgi:hypothetical protein
MPRPRPRKILIAGFCCFALIPSINSLAFAPAEFRSFQTAQVSVFSSWRPYSNPDRLISVGMNKGEVLAIAGKPDHEESYYQGGGRLIRISDWYYIRSGFDAQTTILKFAQESLVSITSTSTF